MGRFFGYDGPFVSALERTADIVILNIIFIICCVPLFTIGAALTALSSVTQKMAGKEEGYTVRGFFSSFRQNFIQATVIWIILVICGMIFFIDLKLVDSAGSGPVFLAVRTLLMMAGMVYIFEFIYVFPMLARFDNSIRNTMKNALLLSVKYLPWTVVLILTAVLPVAAGLLFYQIAAPVFVFAGFSLISLVSSYIFKRLL